MLPVSQENFSENGARPVQFLGSLLPIDRLGALVFRPLDRHGNAIVGGRTRVRPTRIAGRAVSRADAPAVGKTFLPKRTLVPQSEPRTDTRWNHHLAPNTDGPVDVAALTAHPLIAITPLPKKPDEGDRPRRSAALFPSFEYLIPA
jgi:hypothetical protein